MDDLVAWLRAQLDEDERVALAWPEDRRSWKSVGDRHLRYASGSGEAAIAVDVSGRQFEWWEQIWVRRATPDQGEHIVRHDPARVLADVAAKRAIVDEHEAQYPDTSYAYCRVCHVYDLVHDAMPAPCRTLRLLATAYAGQPGWRAEWRPDTP